MASDMRIDYSVRLIQNENLPPSPTTSKGIQGRDNPFNLPRGLGLMIS